MSRWTIHFDGALPGGVAVCGVTWGNGEAAGGSCSVRVPRLTGQASTTNIAEWGGLVQALEIARKISKRGDEVVVRGDSQLVVRQMSGQYRLRKPHLAWYYRTAKDIVRGLEECGIKVAIEWVPREENTTADRLSKVDPGDPP